MKNSIVSVGLINPKSPDNVSSVMRTAGNFQVTSVFYTGTRYPRALELNPASPNLRRKVSHSIPLSALDSVINDAPENLSIVCIEFAENAIPLPEYQHPQNAFYIFGPEDGSISQNVIDAAAAVIYVPTTGCMNLAATVNVVLYDRLSKSFLSDKNSENNNLIRLSRDINNKLKVRNRENE